MSLNPLSTFWGTAHYLYTWSGSEINVTFTVEEEKSSGFPVVFENFVWLTDDEIQSFIKKEVPSFNGRLTQASVEAVRRVLQQKLLERKIQARVDVLPSDKSEIVFSLEGKEFPMCQFSFEGASGIKEDELLSITRTILLKDYRKSFVTSYAFFNIIPVYNNRGYLRASIAAPLVALVGSGEGKCRDGVSVKLAVTEGLQYSWEDLRWQGNSAFTVDEINTRMKLARGKVANLSEFTAGLEAVKELYGTMGYVFVRLAPEPAYDDEQRRVSYRITVTEGDQYRMGRLSISGVPDSTAKKIAGKWKLKEGDVYNASYIRTYRQDIYKTEESVRNMSVKTRERVNIERKTLDVLIELE
jgi:outer membrane protein assembly factor BamA